MKIEVKKHDGLGAFGAFISDCETEEGKKIILLDVELICKDGEMVFEDGTPVKSSPEERKRVMIETLMHEFGHALEECFETEFDEDFIEKVCESYNQN